VATECQPYNTSQCRRNQILKRDANDIGQSGGDGADQ
jgi:hypothetical protein